MGRIEGLLTLLKHGPQRPKDQVAESGGNGGSDFLTTLLGAIDQVSGLGSPALPSTPSAAKPGKSSVMRPAVSVTAAGRAASASAGTDSRSVDRFERRTASDAHGSSVPARRTPADAIPSTHAATGTRSAALQPGQAERGTDSSAAFRAGEHVYDIQPHTVSAAADRSRSWTRVPLDRHASADADPGASRVKSQFLPAGRLQSATPASGEVQQPVANSAAAGPTPPADAGLRRAPHASVLTPSSLVNTGRAAEHKPLAERPQGTVQTQPADHVYDTTFGTLPTTAAVTAGLGHEAASGAAEGGVQLPALHVNTPEAPRVVSDLIVNQIRTGPDQLHVQVHPQGMGDIVISVVRDQGSLHVRVEANQMQTAQWFLQQSDNILHDLRSGGMDVASLDVTFGQAALNGGQGGDANPNSSPRRQRGDSPWSPVAGATRGTATASSSFDDPVAMDGRISIRI